MENDLDQTSNILSPDSASEEKKKTRKEPIIFVIALNLIFGGASYILLHYYKRFFILIFFSFAFSFLIGGIAPGIAIVIALIDTYMIARKYNKGEKDLPPSNKNLQIISIILIVFIFGLKFVPENLLVFNTRVCDRLYSVGSFLQGEKSFGDIVQKRINCYGDVLRKKSYVPISQDLGVYNKDSNEPLQSEKKINNNPTIAECDAESYYLRKACYFYHSFKEGSSKYCDNNIFAVMKEYCVTDLARLLGNKNLCSSIGKKHLKEYCERRVEVFGRCQKVDCQGLFEKSSSLLSDEESTLREDCCLSRLTSCNAVLDPNEKALCLNKYNVYEDMVDSIDNNNELIHEVGLNNSDIDSDNDGLSDADEEKYGTDLNNPDTDGDGYSDGDEVKNGFNPNGEGTLPEGDKIGLVSNIANILKIQENLKKTAEPFLKIETQDKGDKIIIAYTDWSKNSFLVIKKPDSSGKSEFIAVSSLLKIGRNENFEIPLGKIVSGVMLDAYLFEDNGDGVFNESSDSQAIDPRNNYILTQNFDVRTR